LSFTCSRGDAVGWEGTFSDSAGLTVISNPADGLWRQGSEWRAVQDLLIGEAEGNPDYLFGRIAGICVDTGGRIYVVDEAASSARVYSPDGVFLDAFGQMGSGPEDLGNALGPCLMEAGDTLAIPDLQNYRVSRFDTNGSSVPGTPFDIRRGIPVRWEMTGDGRLAVQLRFLGFMGEAAPGTPDAVVLWNTDGSVSDTLLQFPAGTAISMSEDGPHFNLLAADPVWTLTAEAGIAYGFSSDYRIAFYDSTGATVRIINKPTETVPVTTADERIFMDALQHVFPQSLFRQFERNIQLADHYPAFFRFQFGPQESLWVQQVSHPSELSEEERDDLSYRAHNPEVFLANPRLALGAPDWDVFDAQGRFLGEVTLPKRFELVRFVGDVAYGVWRDEMDVEYVMRLKVVMR
jgi:hypothetical protein